MRCSTTSRRLHESAAGTAARADFWMLLEQPGPWGAKAPTQSHLDAELGAALDTTAARVGARLSLIRRPAAHADHGGQASRRVFLADSRPGRTYLLTTEISDPHVLLGLDWQALASGDRHAVARSLPGSVPQFEPILLVCTNGRRDVCCALLGRPVALTLADEFGPRVWEANHLGGHRFAPTSLLLPWGFSHARLDPVRGEQLLSGASDGALVLEDLRGRSTWSSAGQAAEVFLRSSRPPLGLDAVAVVRELVQGAVHTVTLSVWETEQVTVALRRQAAPDQRPESCGKPDVPMTRWIPFG